MSLIGKRVEVKYPVSNEKTETLQGVVLDKFQNSFTSENKKGEDLVVTYDNYLVEKDNNEVTAVHPTLIKKIIHSKEMKLEDNAKS